MRAKGVEVVDLTQDFAAAKAQGPLYCARDSHWNGRAIVLAAQKLAPELKGLSEANLELEAREEQIEIQGDLGGAKEKATVRFINPKGQTARLEPDRASPILILGDSYVLVFHDGGDMHASGAGLPDQLAFELRAPVDVLGVRGSGATPARVSLARRARANSELSLEQKSGHLVLWGAGIDTSRGMEGNTTSEATKLGTVDHFNISDLPALFYSYEVGDACLAADIKNARNCSQFANGRLARPLGISLLLFFE